MDKHSRHIIARACDKAEGNQTKAAEFLCLQRSYLARLLKQNREKQEGKEDSAEGAAGTAVNTGLPRDR